MSEYPIDKISIDAEGRLLVRPTIAPDQTYEYIYRSATGVHWLPDERSLVAPSPQEWSYLSWYKQIINAIASEYGDRLMLNDETTWTNVPSDIKAEIVEWEKKTPPNNAL